MGAWGPGPFENDSALDWLGELEESGELRDTLKEVLDEEEYLDVDVGSAVVAAAEMIAAAKDGDVSRLNPDAQEWLVANKKAIRDKDAALAVRALKVVMNEERSELAQLWAEGDGTNEWLVAAEALSKRLG